MIFDRTETFSNAQAITGTTASTNVIDTGASGTVLNATTALQRDLGKGNPLPLRISAVQSFNNLTSLQISYQVADDAAFTQNVTTVAQSPAYTLAQMQSGAGHLLPDTAPVGANRRYHRLLYTVTGTAPTLGAITAGFVAGLQTNQVL
jgi:hypothetical protein